ncbi:OsmC family protein [Kitasatospora sp. NBC_01287]|uniref:OsmC family protein n=1 Tax=Kitasatospora sp. NBC_01287 TaxID=2903573 RepID=UPI002259F33A|nr:OsmC family protein [Kitasatospora sp. NBC_01287]MCX4744741.1 OsmC family protein [Kitasatospora sp. NBC_01287]
MQTESIAHEQSLLRTRSGRTIAVSRYGVGTLPPGRGRVVLDTESERYDLGEVWASITSDEARQLAGLLLQQAALVDGTGAEPEHRITAVGVEGDVYAVTVRGHLVTVDQPAAEGGTDAGPTAVELLVASLAGCVAHYAGRHLDHHRVPRAGLRVTADYTMADERPGRVASVDLRLTVPGLPPERAADLLAEARLCTVHTTLSDRPEVTVELEPRS